MAIVGSIEVLKEQTQNQRLLKALNYLSTADISKEFEGVTTEKNKKIEIESDKIFAIYQIYLNKSHDTIKIEGHQQYIDIQYIHEGEEQIFLAPLSAIVENDLYNSEKDLYFPKVESFSIIQLNTTDGAILFPADLHGPGYCVNTPSPVKKIVIKVAVD